MVANFMSHWSGRALVGLALASLLVATVAISRRFVLVPAPASDAGPGAAPVIVHELVTSDGQPPIEDGETQLLARTRRRPLPGGPGLGGQAYDAGQVDAPPDEPGEPLQAQPRDVSQTPPQAPPPAPPQLVALSLYNVEQELVAHTNAARIAAGLDPLLIDQAIMETARAHTIAMASSGRMYHGRNFPAAENVAWGSTTAQDVVGSWMRSPGHRANILGKYRYLGTAGYIGRRDGAMYWTQQFR